MKFDDKTKKLTITLFMTENCMGCAEFHDNDGDCKCLKSIEKQAMKGNGLGQSECLKKRKLDYVPPGWM